MVDHWRHARLESPATPSSGERVVLALGMRPTSEDLPQSREGSWCYFCSGEAARAEGEGPLRGRGEGQRESSHYYCCLAKWSSGPKAQSTAQPASPWTPGKRATS
jgi:hypothetical protein